MKGNKMKLFVTSAHKLKASPVEDIEKKITDVIKDKFNLVGNPEFGDVKDGWFTFIISVVDDGSTNLQMTYTSHHSLYMTWDTKLYKTSISTRRLAQLAESMAEAEKKIQPLFDALLNLE